jgi:hypothetical protein
MIFPVSIQVFEGSTGDQPGVPLVSTSDTRGRIFGLGGRHAQSYSYLAQISDMCIRALGNLPSYDY